MLCSLCADNSFDHNKETIAIEGCFFFFFLVETEVKVRS